MRPKKGNKVFICFFLFLQNIVSLRYIAESEIQWTENIRLILKFKNNFFSSVPSLALSDVPLLDLRSSWQVSHRNDAELSGHIRSGAYVSICPVTGSATFDHWVKWCLPDLSTVKLLFRIKLLFTITFTIN